LDAAIGDVPSDLLIAGASAMAKILAVRTAYLAGDAALDDRIDNLGVEAGNANAEVTAARTSIVYGTAPASLSDALALLGNGARNVKSHGAVGDGVTNDTTAVQAALTAGGTVIFPPGDYLVTGLTSGAADHIIGIGDARLVTASNAAILVVSAGDVRIDNMRFAGDGKGATYDGGKTSQHAISITTKYRTRITNCHFYTLGGSGVYVTLTTSAYNGTVVNGCVFDTCNRGITSATQGEYMHVSNCEIVSGNYGVHVMGGNCLFNGCNITGNKTNVYLASGTNDSHGIFSGCNLNHATEYSVKSEAIANGETFSGCHLYAGSIWLQGSGISFRGCHIDQAAYYFQGCAAIIEGCTLPASYANTIYNNYSGSSSLVLWQNNRRLTMKQFTNWSQNFLGGYVKATHAAADITYANSASDQQVVFDTNAGTGVANHTSSFTAYSFYDTGTGVFTARGLNGGNVTMRMRLFFTKPGNWDALTVGVFIGATRITYVPLVSFSATKLIAALDTPIFANDGSTITVQVNNQTGGNVTLEKTNSYIEFVGL
jgi:hypothetical protein